MPLVLEQHQSRFARGIAPATNWVTPVAPEPNALTEGVLEQSRSQWLQFCSLMVDAVFKQKVYENEDLKNTDLRMHRLILNSLLCDGEQLVLFHLLFAEQSNRMADFASRVAEIDAKNAELLKILLQWHGPVEAQYDFPEELREAMQQVAAGQIEEMREL